VYKGQGRIRCLLVRGTYEAFRIHVVSDVAATILTADERFHGWPRASGTGRRLGSDPTIASPFVGRLRGGSQGGGNALVLSL